MQETTDATAIFAPLWRRKWLILAVGLVVGVASYFYYRQATRTFSAETQVYLGAGSEEQPAGEKQVKTTGVEVSNQAAIINSIVIEQVRRQLRREHKGALSTSKVKARAAEKSEFVTISSEGHTERGTVLIANRVAEAYIRRRNRNRENAINESIALTRRQLARIEAVQAPVKTKSSSSAGKEKTSTGTSNTQTILQATTLSTKINTLENSLAVTGAQQVKPASHAQLVAPSPRKDAIFGFVVGLVLASIAAYTLGRLDRRLRTLEGIESIFGSHILTALPKASRPIVLDNGQPRPSKVLLEPLRRLHTTLQLGFVMPPGPLPGAAVIGPIPSGLAGSSANGATRSKVQPRKIIFLSADSGDGKSTLVADLALVQRDSGARVAIVEANFRRPVLARRLGVEGTHGLAEVLSGSLSVEEATQRVTPPITDTGEELAETPGGGLTSTLTARRAGSLFVLLGSTSVANPPAVMAGETMPKLLDELAEEYDYVLIDAPSPLEFSDVMPLLRVVDGIVLVARAAHTRELSAQRFTQLLAQTAEAPVLGTVANCVSKSDMSRYGLTPAGGQTWLGRITGR